MEEKIIASIKRLIDAGLISVPPEWQASWDEISILELRAPNEDEKREIKELSKMCSRLNKVITVSKPDTPAFVYFIPDRLEAIRRVLENTNCPFEIRIQEKCIPKTQ